MSPEIRVGYAELVAFTAGVFAVRGVPPTHAELAAEALCHGDLTGHGSHGLANLTRLYLPLFDDKRVEPATELAVVADRGAAVLVDAQRGLGLWVASEVMDLAVRCAAAYGIGMVSVFNATHFGCAGFHAARAVDHQMIGLLAANCGRQRIARPPGGRLAMLGTNPISVAAPAGDRPPYVLDMSTTVAPTGRVRVAARAGEPVPEGWLADDVGNPVTDPAAFDGGTAHLLWLGSRPETGAFKGYGLGLLVEILAALLPGAGRGPEPEALNGDGRPSGRDDDIGFFALAVAPGALRPSGDFLAEADELFGTLLACPPVDPASPVRYPGLVEAERAELHRRSGVPLAADVYADLAALAGQLGVAPPEPLEGAR